MSDSEPGSPGGHPIPLDRLRDLNPHDSMGELPTVESASSDNDNLQTGNAPLGVSLRTEIRRISANAQQIRKDLGDTFSDKTATSAPPFKALPPHMRPKGMGLSGSVFGVSSASSLGGTTDSMPPDTEQSLGVSMRTEIQQTLADLEKREKELNK